MSEKKRGLKLLFFSMLIVFLMNSAVSAEFSKGNASYSISKTYVPEKNLQGWINISFENHPADSTLKDNFGNSINLLEFLNANQDLTEYFSCVPKDCKRDFYAENPEKEKIIHLSPGEKKIIGFKISEKLKNVDEVNFNIESNASEDCKNQLKIYFFGNNSIALMNNKSTSSICEETKTNGCFNESKTNFQEFFLENNGNLYCQKIILPESPKIIAKAWIKSSDEDTVTIWLYDKNFENKAKCSFSASESYEGYEGCEINYAVNKDDYYICISSEKDKATSIKGYKIIKGYEEGCGFYYSGELTQDYNYAFDFFVKGFKFDSVGEIKVKNKIPGNSKPLSELLEEYIKNKYNENLDCSDTCIIPVVVSSKSNQDITIKNLELYYYLGDGPLTKEDNFYDLREDSAKINSEGFLKISLNSINFTLPKIFGNYSYKLSIDDSEIFSDEIVIEKAPEIISLSPLLTVSGFPTKLKLKVKLADNASITNYVWNIDNTIKTTYIPELDYAFPAIKTAPGYRVEVNVTDSNGKKSSKEFYVRVGTPRAIIEEKLLKMKNNLEAITSQINNFPVFYQKSIKQKINLKELNEKITELQGDYSNVSEESDYYQIIEKLLDLRIPESIDYGVTTGSISFYPSADNINLYAVSKIAGGEYQEDKEPEYKEAVLEWNENHLATKAKYSQINAYYEEGKENLVNILEFHIKEAVHPETDYYLFIKKDAVLFDKDYNEKETEGYYAVMLKPDSTIIFSTTEGGSLAELPVFISPSLDKLDVSEITPSEKKRIKWALFILLMLFLIFLGLIVYAVLQYWYKTKYETYLFKNRNYLFNLINYIHAQKEKGEAEKEMIKKLKNQGWTSEQINYVLKKYIGKRTGMIEIIPVEKIVEWFEKIKNPFKKPALKSTPQYPQKQMPQKRFVFRNFKKI